jgi:hypothetical protein
MHYHLDGEPGTASGEIVVTMRPAALVVRA